jgi:competence protein ComEC
MPAGLLGLVAMPFGFDRLFWVIMGAGIDWMIAVTQWVAALPGAVGRVPAFGIGPLIAASLGIILLGLLRTPLRWSGAVLVLLSALWAARVPQPDILISADGRHVGVRGQDGRLHLMHAAKGSRDVFLLKEWLAADADARTAADASLTAGVSCDDFGCVMQSAGGGLVAQTFRPEALADDCERAALIVTLRQAPAACAASVIDCRTAAAAGRHGVAANPCGIFRRGSQTEGNRPPLVAGRGRGERGRRHRSCAACRAAARGRRDAGRGRPSGGGIERFPAKWRPVRVKKTRQIKNLEPQGSRRTSVLVERGA